MKLVDSLAMLGAALLVALVLIEGLKDFTERAVQQGSYSWGERGKSRLSRD